MNRFVGETFGICWIAAIKRKKTLAYFENCSARERHANVNNKPSPVLRKREPLFEGATRTEEELWHERDNVVLARRDAVAGPLIRSIHRRMIQVHESVAGVHPRTSLGDPPQFGDESVDDGSRAPAAVEMLALLLFRLTSGDARFRLQQFVVVVEERIDGLRPGGGGSGRVVDVVQLTLAVTGGHLRVGCEGDRAAVRVLLAFAAE